MLSVRAVSKRYGKSIVLDSATFELQPGEVLATVGSNGAGKSTLIKAVIGLIRFDGDVSVDGIDVRRHGREARARIGYLPQNPAFHTDLNVRETVTFFAQLRGAAASATRSAVEAVGLAEHAEKQVRALSGGMRQRLALAIAQLGDPPLLMLDEPATGLDVAARLELRQFIHEQRALGKAILLSTHWLDDVPSIADRVIVLDEGRTTFDGPAAAFATRAVARSLLYVRLNGHSGEAIPLIQATGGDVTRSGDWLAITCPANHKAHVMETLLGAGITILDFRVEEAAAPSAPGPLPGGTQ